MAHTGFVPCHNLHHQIIVAIHHSQPLPTSVFWWSNAAPMYSKLYACPTPSQFGQLSFVKCSDWPTIDELKCVGRLQWRLQRYSHWFLFHHSQLPSMQDEFCRITSFFKRFMLSTNGCLAQTSITIHISHLCYRISHRQSSTHTIPDKVTLFYFLFGFHHITEHTKHTTRV